MKHEHDNDILQNLSTCCESSCPEVKLLQSNLCTTKLSLRNRDDRSGRHKNRRQVSRYNSPDKLRAFS